MRRPPFSAKGELRMRLTFLGTGTAEMYPAMWCECPNCTAARRAGGRNIRGNSAALVDSDILLDMNAPCFLVAAQHGVSLAGVRHAFITHPHPDHFIPERLHWRRMREGLDALPFGPEIGQWGARYTKVPRLTLHGNGAVEEALSAPAHDVLRNPEVNACVQFERIQEGVETDCGDFTFVPVRANHKTPGFTHNYILTRGGKTLLYALDTGGYDDDSLELILSRRYDCVVMEGTFGLGYAKPELDTLPPRELLRGTGHMNLQKNRAMLRLLTESGCWKGKPRMILSHICPHFSPPHDAYAKIVEAAGMELAYDGLATQI